MTTYSHNNCRFLNVFILPFYPQLQLPYCTLPSDQNYVCISYFPHHYNRPRACVFFETNYVTDFFLSGFPVLLIPFTPLPSSFGGHSWLSSNQPSVFILSVNVPSSFTARVCVCETILVVPLNYTLEQ